MFSGIIEGLGRVQKVENLETGLRLNLNTGFKLDLGESLAVNGVCLTVSEILDNTQQSFFVSSETLKLTNLKNIDSQSSVNLERSLRLQDRNSGHWVQGHVEGLARIENIESIGEDWNLSLRLSPSLMKYCIHKGSICVNGVSLTINQLEDRVFENGDGRVLIRLVPHTLKSTQFQFCKVGDTVNVETDVIAKYVERLLHERQV